MLLFSGLGLLKETKTVIPGVAEVITRTRINFIGLSSSSFFWGGSLKTETNQPTRERERERERQRQTDRQTKRERETDRQTERQANMQAEKERD